MTFDFHKHQITQPLTQLEKEGINYIKVDDFPCRGWKLCVPHLRKMSNNTWQSININSRTLLPYLVDTVIFPVETCNFIMGHAHSTFVSTRPIDDMEDTLICDGGATCTLTKSLENCTLCKPKVVEIQTAHGATIMRTTHLCYKTYFVKDRLG